jgi:hypothetical protein
MKFYPALTYLLIPFAILLGLMNLLSLAFVFVNPSVLIVVFGLTCYVLHTFSSLRFLKQVVKGGQILTTKFKDWLKVNAIASFLLCFLFFYDAIYALSSNNVELTKIIKENILQQPGIPKEYTLDFFLSMINAIYVLFLLIGIIGIVQITMTFRLIKRHYTITE